MPGLELDPKTTPLFPMAAKAMLGDAQLRNNVRHATEVIQAKRARVVGETADWQQLREAGKQIRRHTMQYLDVYLEQFETNCTQAGGVVHWGARCRGGRGALSPSWRGPQARPRSSRSSR